MPAVTGEGADVVGKPAVARRDEIGERHDWRGPRAWTSCWRSVCSVAIGVARLVGEHQNVVALRLAGQKPRTALAVNQFSATIRFSIARASS